MKWIAVTATAALTVAIAFAVPISLPVQARQTQARAAPAPSVAPGDVLNKYCVTCHNERLRTAGLALDRLDVARPAASADVWERVIEKLRAASMPPPGNARPDAATYHAVATLLETAIDREWTAGPNPGRISAVHRLNRTEYHNAIRDLFGLHLDVRSMLPGDETADGSFDNIADVLSISTTHLERYLSVARQVTRLAVGLPPVRPTVETFEIPLHVIQDDRQSEDLPFGSRGGLAVRHQFPVDGEYLITVRLQRQYQDYIKGMGWPQQLDIRLDGRLLKRFTVGGGARGRPAATSYAGDGEPGFAGDPEWEKYMQITGDAGLEVRLPVAAGPHVVGVSFVRELWEPQGLPHPQQRGRVIANDNVYMGYANVGSVQIGGPYTKTGARTDTPGRRAVFVCQPRAVSDERGCATRILSRIARLAYRRPVSRSEVQALLPFFESGRQEGGSFDAGIQLALERILVDPDFLLRVYRDPSNVTSGAGRTSSSQTGVESGSNRTGVASGSGQTGAESGSDRTGVGSGSSRAGTESGSNRSGVASGFSRTYRLNDLEVASRLSFFLWSSIPDERLLDLAERRQLTNPPILEREVRRMLADPRAAALVSDFAAQWLNLRRVEEVVVDPERYPNYDESLLQAFRQETELFIDSTLREDRSVVDLLKADYTFVNERLARHYGIPGIYGSRFRRVTLRNANQRGGLLAQGALLATTSYPDRTSPVLRGKFLLNNIFGLPTPPPPPGVDTNLAETKPGAPPASIRERLAQHRTNPSCASCHAVIDPLGFALEHFDAIGGWRTVDESGRPVDASGTTVSGARVDGLAGLRALLLERPDQFPRTVTEKLMAYALGRRLEYYDRPAVRAIVRDAAAGNYRWSSIVVGIVKSPPFLMRTAGSGAN